MIKAIFLKPNKCKLLLFIIFLLLFPGYYLWGTGYCMSLGGGCGYASLTTPLIEIIEFITDGLSFERDYIPNFSPLIINIPLSYFLSCCIAYFCKKNQL